MTTKARSAATKRGILPWSEQPKLSDVAKHLVVPDGITATGWPAVRDRAKQFGVSFDRWQDGWGRLMLAKDKNGVYASAVGGVTASIPRQVGKTYTLGAITFALCVNEPGHKMLWTAHRGQTAAETFLSMQSMAKNKNIAPHIESVRRTTGEESVIFKNGSRIMFGAREQGFGRGFPEVSFIVFDEAQILTERALDDMTPSTNAVENALIVKIGTPPKPEDRSDVFLRARQKALEGGAKNALYLELGADRGASADDWEQVGKANPSYRVGRTSKTAILRMKENLSEESYIREGLGIWDELQVEASAVNAVRWRGLKVTPAGIPEDGRKAYGVKFSVDGSEVALSVALRPAEGPIHVEGIRSEPMSAGTSWLVDFLADRHREAAQIVIDGRSGSGALVNDLREAGVRNKKLVIIPTLDQVITAHSMMKASVDEGTLTHSAQEELDGQVEHALKRKIGNNGGYGWEAPDGKSVTVFEAATLAHWGAKTTTRRPGAGSSIGMVMT